LWSLPAFARFDDGFWRFVSASKNSVPGGRGRALLVIDETGFLKQGKASCGVARQYTG